MQRRSDNVSELYKEDKKTEKSSSRAPDLSATGSTN